MITRTFLDWSRPALEQAAAYLVDRYRHDRMLDLDGVVVVVPGARAGRRLDELLLDRAARDRLTFFPPRTMTVGRLPEELYENRRPFATDLVQQLAWVSVLRNLGRRRVARLVPQPPDVDDLPGWLDLGNVLAAQHRELAADGLSFQDVAERGRGLPGFPETARWRFLAGVQNDYLALLDRLGLWDRQTARLFAIEHGECHTEHDIVLAGTVDMNRAQRRMLSQVASRVTSLVFAPPSRAADFDEFGCLVPAAWLNARLEVPDQSLHLADGPGDQARAVRQCLERLTDDWTVDEITIGVPDEGLVPSLTRQLGRAGIRTHWAAGRRLPETPACRLLRGVGHYMERGRYADLAALLRHPDIDDWLETNGFVGDRLTRLDEFYRRHLPPRLRGQRVVENDAELATVIEAIEVLVAPLSGDPRRLDEWSEPIAEVLTSVYAGRSLDENLETDHQLAQSLRMIRGALLEQQAVPEGLAPRLPASQAATVLLDSLRRATVPPMPRSGAVEMLGWLELPLDTAPALIVTSLNEGSVPTSVNSDLFLPNRLRAELELTDNARRYARDAYALQVLLASRQSLQLVLGRRDDLENPLLPSRLLFATDPRSRASRAKWAFGGEFEEEESRTDAVETASPEETSAESKETHSLMVPRPRPLPEPIRSMSVTSFRTYLACPYRFYLRYGLGLEAICDDAEELDALGFGSLAHDALKRFGEDRARESARPEQIRRTLRRLLTQCLRETYGQERMPAVEVQAMQLRMRLEAFADWQAEWIASGWRVEHTEVDVSRCGVTLRLGDDEPMGLRGRIDRIDRHRETGAWALLDYKTGNTAKAPGKAHRRSDGEWLDLQLPLYALFADALGLDGPGKLGFISLPRDLSQVGASFADWTEAELREAHALAADIARRVRAEEFWPPTWPPPFPDFADICQDYVFDRRLEAAEGML